MRVESEQDGVPSGDILGCQDSTSPSSLQIKARGTPARGRGLLPRPDNAGPENTTPLPLTLICRKLAVRFI